MEISGIVLLILILQAVISGLLASFVAGEKNYSGSNWLFIGLLFGVFGLIAAAGLPKKKGTITEEITYSKKCPQCGEHIRREAFVCKYCNNSFNREEVITQLFQELKIRNHKRRAEVLSILEVIGNSSILPSLIEVLRDAHSSYKEFFNSKDYYVRPIHILFIVFSKALHLVHKFGDKSVSKVFLEILEDYGDSIDLRVLELIADIFIKEDNPAIIPFLIKYQFGYNKSINLYAANSLEKFGKKALPELQEYAKTLNKKQDIKKIEMIIERIKLMPEDKN